MTTDRRVPRYPTPASAACPKCGHSSTTHGAFSCWIVGCECGWHVAPSGEWCETTLPLSAHQAAPTPAGPASEPPYVSPSGEPRAAYEPCTCRRLFLHPDEETMGPMVDDGSYHTRTGCYALCGECGARCDVDGYCNPCAEKAVEAYRAEHGGRSPAEDFKLRRAAPAPSPGSGLREVLARLVNAAPDPAFVLHAALDDDSDPPSMIEAANREYRNALDAARALASLPEATPPQGLRERIVAHLNAAKLTQARLIIEGLWPSSAPAPSTAPTAESAPGCWGQPDACMKPGCSCCDPEAKDRTPPPGFGGRAAPAAPEVDLGEVPRALTDYAASFVRLGGRPGKHEKAAREAVEAAVRSLVERARRATRLEDCRVLAHAADAQSSVQRAQALHDAADVLRALTPSVPGAADEEG